MSVESRYRERYKSGDTPWDIGRPDFNLIEVVTQTPVASCRVLDVGCGSGDNSMWLAENRFQVTGTDTSDVAIGKAREKAAKAGVECDFRVADFLGGDIESQPFGFIFDRGCFHSFPRQGDRKRFAEKVAAHLAGDGLWLMLAGNADENRRGPGPPQRTALDIVQAVEPDFEILSLQSSRFGSNHPNPPRAWRCLMRKRTSNRRG